MRFISGLGLMLGLVALALTSRECDARPAAPSSAAGLHRVALHHHHDDAKEVAAASGLVVESAHAPAAVDTIRGGGLLSNVKVPIAAYFGMWYVFSGREAPAWRDLSHTSDFFLLVQVLPQHCV